MIPGRFHALLTRTILVLSVAAGCLPAARAENATRIYAGVYLHDVTKFDQKDGVFDADFEFWAKWRGEFDPESLVIANASQVEKESMGVEQDGDWHTARWRVRGTMRGRFRLERFPFDKQTLAVVFELPERFGELAPDLAGSGMRERFSITGWDYSPYFVPRVSQEVYGSDLGSIDSEGLPTRVGRTAFEVSLRRPFVIVATKLFLPLLVILLVAFIPLFVHPKELEVRASVGVTALLSCFAFHFAVSDSMPNVSYITLAESLFLVSYGVCAALLIVSVAAAAFHERGQHLAHKTLDRVSVFAFPCLFAAATILMAPSVPEVQGNAPVKVESEALTLRPESSRDVLRVGTNRLSLGFGLIPQAANWGTTRSAPGELSFPVLVNEAPSITNEALKFFPDGRLEVTWRLLPNLHWSDGMPLTADDLLFALEIAADERIDSKQAVNSTELVVGYKKRVASATREIIPLPRHSFPAETTAGGPKAVQDYRSKNRLPSTGPYFLNDWDPDKRAVLIANPHFVGRPPSIKQIEIQAYSEAGLIEAFDKGEIDMISPNAVSPEAALAYAKKRPDAVSVRFSDVLLFLHPDLSNPLLAKLSVRKALLQCIDRARLRDEVFGEAASSVPIAHIPVPVDLPTGAVKTPYDLAAAKAELEREGLLGAHLPLFHGSSSFELAVVARLVRDAAAAGVILEPQLVESTYKLLGEGNHGGLLLIQRTGLRNDEPERFWGIPQSGSQYNRDFRTSAFDVSILDLVEREERALYPERRDQIRDTLFAEFSQRLPLLPLFFRADVTVVDPDLKGWKGGTGKSFGVNVERWYFATPAEPPPGTPPPP